MINYHFINYLMVSHGTKSETVSEFRTDLVTHLATKQWQHESLVVRCCFDRENCHWLGFTLWITTKEFHLLVSNTSFVRQFTLKFAVWVALRTSCTWSPCVRLSTILRELLRAINILEKELSHPYNPLWLNWINVVLKEEARRCFWAFGQSEKRIVNWMYNYYI